MIWIALTVRFLLELALLGAWGVVAHQSVEGAWRWPATLALPLVVIVVWSLWLAPKAKHRLGTAGQIALELVLFGGAAAALWSIGAGTVGLVGLALWLVDRVAIMVLGGLPDLPRS